MVNSNMKKIVSEMLVKKIVIALLVFLVHDLSGQQNGNREVSSSWKEVDSLFRELDNTSSPGVSLAITWNHQPVYVRSYGMADIENKVKVTEETSFNLASLTKQFTAYAVLLLAEQRKLSMEDPITKYLPELSFFKEITVRQLMNQTSGIPSDRIGSYGSFANGGAPELLRLYEAQSLVSKPGTQWAYNNNNYNFLSIIVERASGKALTQFLYEEVFTPLGMKHSYFPFGPGATKVNRAYGYVSRNNQYVNVDRNDVFVSLMGAGGMYSSISDLMLWDKAFYNKSYAAQQRGVDGKYFSGDPVSYGAGVNVSHYDGVLSFEHGGTSGATSTYMATYPEYGASIIILVASNYFHADQGARKLTQLIRKELFERYASESKPKVDLPTWTNWSPEKMKSISGTWFGELNAFLQKVEAETNEAGVVKLKFFDGVSLELKQVGQNTFGSTDLPGIVIRIKNDEMVFLDENKNLGLIKKITGSKVSNMPTLVGNYTAPALNNGVWSFSIQDGSFLATSPSGRTMPLEHIYGNVVGNTMSNIYFEQVVLAEGKRSWVLMAGQIPKIQLLETNVQQALLLIKKALEQGGSKAAWEQYNTMRKQRENFDFSEPGLNSMGYSLLQSKKPEEALAVFQMMVELFPTSANALDSMADGLLANDKKEEAIKAYRSILLIDPHHSNARYMLSELEKKSH